MWTKIRTTQSSRKKKENVRSLKRSGAVIPTTDALCPVLSKDVPGLSRSVLLFWSCSRNRSTHASGFLLHFFRLKVRSQRFDQGLQFPIHDFLKLVDSQANPVIGHPVLWEVVGPNLLAAIARAHHRLAFLG